MASNKTLRGGRLGVQSKENPIGVELSQRQEVEYRCELGHVNTHFFASDTEIPPTWECRCGLPSDLVTPADSISQTVAEITEDEERVVRTHWDMLLERRTIPELEEILQERLAILRAKRAG